MPSPEVWRRECARYQRIADARRIQEQAPHRALRGTALGRSLASAAAPWIVALVVVALLSLLTLGLWGLGIR